MATEIRIRTDYITLGQMLKLADCVSTGGEAKAWLQEKKIVVNGSRESRRGRKLYEGDLIEVESCGAFRITRG